MSNRHEINSDLINGTTVEDVIGNLHLQLNAARTDSTVLRLLLIREGQAHRQCLKELQRVAEFAQCMGSPVEYEDDTVYLKGIKEFVSYLVTERETHNKERQCDTCSELDRLKEECARLREEIYDSISKHEAKDIFQQGREEAAHEWRKALREAEAKLSRYESGIEVEGRVNFKVIELDHDVPYDLQCQRVKVLIMKEGV